MKLCVDNRPLQDKYLLQATCFVTRVEGRFKIETWNTSSIFYQPAGFSGKGKKNREFPG
jgi:hypothetical protein